MKWRSLSLKMFAAGAILLIQGAAADDQPAEEPSADTSVQYFPLDAPTGFSQAVVVDGQSLVHTRQLLPLDSEGKVVAEHSVEQQVEQVLDNLDAVLTAAESGRGRLVRVHVYALAPPTIDCVREQLAKRLDPAVRPAITSVLTPLPHRDALVAVDAIATAPDKGQTVTFTRCDTVAGDESLADAAVLPRGGVAYLSGVPAEGGLTESAVTKSMAGLWKTMDELDLKPSQVVQLKVFLRPATSADDVLAELKKYFPDQMTPPVVFVEWLAPPPVEIELIAQLRVTDESAAKIEYYNSPDVRPMQIFSRVALVRTARQIYLSSLYAREAGRGQEQALDVFDRLQTILDQVGSDLRHLAKATYYVYDDDSARGMDRARLWLYDQDRPPAASKCMVHGVGQTGRTLTMDMIAIEK